MPSVRLLNVRFFRRDMQTRFPFRYGIASMTDVPHLLVVVAIELDGRVAHGVSADGLPPKWFTKYPSTTFAEDDLPAMLRVVRHASDLAIRQGPASSFFEWWMGLYQEQSAWAQQQAIPQLLAGFGTSLIERAVLDAVCRGIDIPLIKALHLNLLGVDLAALRPSIQVSQPSRFLAAEPLKQVRLRHTIGLGDPIGPVPNSERPNDGLPFSLEENIVAYGLTHFKIKLSGKIEADKQRLLDIAAVLNKTVGPAARFTFDGNENYETILQFRSAWSELLEEPILRKFFDASLLFVEQPVHRSVALADTVAGELRHWPNAPPIIIDESDADLQSLPKALMLGYRGTSHKNCKGIIKGLLNSATIRSASTADRPLILSAEDLGNVGPVALLQDLAMVAALGITHVERNGHHYFAGLSMFPEDTQLSMLEYHADLYSRRADGLVALAPKAGCIALQSVSAAPFGTWPLVNWEQFEPWEF